MTSMVTDDVVDENRPINKLAAFIRTNNNEKQRNQRALVPLQTMDTNRLAQPTATLDDFDHDESPIKNEGLKTSEPPMLRQPVVLSPILHNIDNSGYLLEMKNSGMKTIPLYEEDDLQDDLEEGSTWRERSTLHDNEEVSTTSGVEMDEKKKELHDDGGDGEEEEDVLPGLIPSQMSSQIPSQMVEDLDASVVIVEGEMVPLSDTDPDGDVGGGAGGFADFIPPYTTEHQHQLSPSYHHTSPSSSLSSSSTSIHHDTSKDLNVYDNAYGATTTTATVHYPSPSQYGTTVHYPSPSSQSSHQSHQHTAVSPSGYIEFIPPPPPVLMATTVVPVFGTKGVPGTCKGQGLGPLLFSLI